MKVLELFGGIGAPRAALERLGIKATYKLVEFDKNVVNVYNKLWNEENETIDIRNFKTTDHYDLVVAGFPCQPFSNAGKSQGFDDEKGRGNLFKEAIRVIKETNPKYVILENVKGILQKKHIWIIEEINQQLGKMGYLVNTGLLNAKQYGSIQARERVYIYGIKDKPPQHAVNHSFNLSMKTLADYLEKDLEDAKYYKEEKLQKIIKWKAQEKPLKKATTTTTTTKTITTRTQPGTASDLIVIDNVGGQERVDLEDIITNRTRIKGLFYESFNSENYITGHKSQSFGTLTAQGANSRQRVLLEDLKIRSITPREAFRLMGFADYLIDRVIHLPKTHLYYTAGNSMEVGTIEGVLKSILYI